MLVRKRERKRVSNKDWCAREGLLVWLKKTGTVTLQTKTERAVRVQRNIRRFCIETRGVGH